MRDWGCGLEKGMHGFGRGIVSLVSGRLILSMIAALQSHFRPAATTLDLKTGLLISFPIL